MSPRTVLALLRPRQWIKNFLVFAALIFTARFTVAVDVATASWAFVAMCLVSSGVYIANDLRDLEQDRLHPVKRNRPLARGAVSIATARTVMVVALISGVGVSIGLGKASFAVVAAYLVLQALYHWGLKAIAVADVFCIASGFVLRAALGAAAISVQISGWLLLCTGALALMVGFGKRRAEYVAMGEDRTRTRAALGQYSERALDALVSTSATGASLCYGVYALESPTAQAHPGLLLTTPFVFYGVCRYLLMVFRGDDTGEPENLFWRDRHLIVTVIGFLVTASLAMMNLPLPLLERAP